MQTKTPNEQQAGQTYQANTPKEQQAGQTNQANTPKEQQAGQANQANRGHAGVEQCIGGRLVWSSA